MISAKVHTKAFNAAMLDIDKRADRAAMWALREAGRQVKRQARRNMRSHNKTGDLSASIKSSRRLQKQGPRTWRITVGPRGFPFLYAAKIEELAGFVQAAHDTVAPKFPQIAQKAADRVTAKYGAF